MAEKLLALVTGAAGAIGYDSAKKLAEAGYRCVGLDLKPSKDAPWPTYACDLSDLAEVTRICETVEREHGVPDVLVNSAGIVRHKKFLDETVEDFDITFAINARGLFFLSQIISKQMIKANKGGSIIHLGSTGPLMGTGDPAYGMTKGAVHALTKSMARELAKYGIRVNAVGPGLIDTPMNAVMPGEVRTRYAATIPLGRAGVAEDIGGVVAFLASDAARYMTGSIVLVNGGLL